MLVGFVAAAFAGTLLRAVAAGGDRDLNRRLFATLAVNVVGAFLLGWLQAADASAVTSLGVGGLGALTTFSTFVAQLDRLHRDGRRRDTISYAAATLLLGLVAAAVGLTLG